MRPLKRIILKDDQAFEKGKVAQYQVKMKVGFRLEE